MMTWTAISRSAYASFLSFLQVVVDTEADRMVVVEVVMVAVEVRERSQL